jgi:hypothetical protein
MPVLDRRSFRKAGSRMEYPVFDRRVILGLPRTELDRWRAEHRALVIRTPKGGRASRSGKEEGPSGCC